MSTFMTPAAPAPRNPQAATPPLDRMLVAPIVSRDPWDWTVDEVVANLCGQIHPLLASRDPRSLPDAVYLETALREHGVDGFTLLVDLDHASLRDDLGIRILGPRGTIVQLIKKFRRQSRKYLDHLYEEAVNTPLPGYGRISSVDQQTRPPSFHHGSPPQYAPRAGSTTSEILRSPVIFQQNSEHRSQPPSSTEETSIPSLQRIEESQDILPEVADLPQSDHQALRRADMIAGHILSDGAMIGAALHDSSAAGEYPEAIGFDAKEEISLENLTMFTNSTENPEPSHRQDETFIVDESGRRRRKLVLGPAELVNADKADEHAVSYSAKSITASYPDEISTNITNDTTTRACDNEDISEEQTISEPQSANLLTTDRIQDKAESLKPLQANGFAPSTSEATQEPGALVIDSYGRKRMMPMLISQPEPVPEIDAEFLDQWPQEIPAGGDVQKSPSNILSDKPSTQNRKLATREPADVYLGVESFPVDKIFYGNISIGKELENDLCYSETLHPDAEDGSDNFTFYTMGLKSRGERRYVGARIKHFLQSKQVYVLGQSRETLVGVVPYPGKIARLHRPLSMTLFSRLQGTTIATRADRSKWLKDDLSRSITVGNLNVDSTSSAFAAADPSLAFDEGSAQDWNYLEKWNYTDDNRIFPAYGESGSDGEYDMDTWLEMEKEKGKIERPLGRRRRERLSDQMVQEIIDEVLKQISRDWHLKEEPKQQPRAWRLWTKSRWDGNKLEQMKKLADDIEKLDDRLLKLREEIAKEEWSAKKELVRQCKIMQPSLFDREFCKWKTSVLKMKSAPEKPTQPIKKPKSDKVRSTKESLREDEENVASDANDTDSSGDDLEDFIVNDDADERCVIDDKDTVMELSDTLLADDENDLEAIAPPESKTVLDPQCVESASQTNLFTPPSKAPPRKFPEIIDLTQHSDSNESDVPQLKAERSTAIRTPPLYPSDDDPFVCNRRKKPQFKLPPVVNSIIALDSDPGYLTPEEGGLGGLKLPNLHNIEGIKKLDPRILVERGDRKRLLLYHISNAPALDRDLAFIFLQETGLIELESDVHAGLKTMKSHGHKIRGVDKEDSSAVMRIAGWLVCWTIPVIITSKGLRVQDVDIVLADKEGFYDFYEFLITCPGLYEKEPIPESLKSEGLTPSKKRLKLLLDRSDHQDTPNKKRRFALPESQATLSLRAGAQQRVQDRDRRQRELKHRFKNMDANDDPSKVVVNTGKFDHQEFIYLNRLIGNCIQPHQIEGVQFMWREITTDPDNLQGCLLAQTMGLGKTMQVITLLVTIAEAAKSSNENIRNQIPSKLRESQTLILCPPALIENWWEEFLMWTPTPTAKNIGEIRKVTTSLKPRERLWEIQAWMDEGGVLLMGFNNFRAYIDNKARTVQGDFVLNEDEHAMVKEALLSKPAIVVADEAHTMKNVNSGINAAMSRIETKSRIALTGSPLMNNLGEYYSLIEWIAPNFLGTRPEFRANFEEPIQEGFYQDSTYGQYRYAMKKLAALKTDLEPKTHRADISVLKGRLKEKQEFVIRVPLTPLQEQIYRIYVDCMLSASTEYEPNTATLWAWLATLRLLCNHPKCFKDRLMAREEEGKKTLALVKRKDKSSSPSGLKGELIPLDKDVAMLDEPVSAIGITKTMVERQLSPFDSLKEPLDSIALANKMQILMDILDFSKKAKDKVLVFSHSIPTLDFIEGSLKNSGRNYSRIDGKIKTTSRQKLTKTFNTGTIEVFLISTKSGGQGLNMFGANRVVIMDGNFNPMYEEQAVGRAYRLGQTKPVFVYYLTVAGTFEEAIQNQSLFKQQLAKRVVDSKNPIRRATKGVGQYLFPPRAIEQKDLGDFAGKDPMVLDQILAKHQKKSIILSMDLTETFHKEDDMKLTDEEKKEAEQMQKDEQLRRRNPGAYNAMLAARREVPWRSGRISTVHTDSWTTNPASRPFSTQGPLMNPSFGVNDYALLHSAPANTLPVLASQLPKNVDGNPSSLLQTTSGSGDPVFGSNPTRKTRPSASVPPEKHDFVGQKPLRGASEPSENPMISLGSSLDSKMNTMITPNLPAKLSTSRVKPPPEMKAFPTCGTGITNMPPEPGHNEGDHNDNGTDGKAYGLTITDDKTETTPRTLGDKEQEEVDDTTPSLKRKRQVDISPSKPSAGPVTAMLNRLLRREAVRSSMG